jgi:hypothetical protein
VSVLELVKGLGDPDDAYKRKVKKGAHRVDISYVLTLFILMLLALDDRLKRFPPCSFSVGSRSFLPQASGPIG